MCIECRIPLLKGQSQNSSYFSGMRNWAGKCPTTTKISKLILGSELPSFSPFTKPAGFRAFPAMMDGRIPISASSVNRPCSAMPTFHNIDSSVLERLSTEKVVLRREDFFGLAEHFPPPLIGKSGFVSKKMVEHLMRHKKHSALGVKYVSGDQITNMEGALHTFVTPVSTILMTGDYTWVGQLQGKPFGNNQIRKVILSAAIHPDFEYDTVMMPLVKVRNQAVMGEVLKTDDIPSAVLKKERGFRSQYEEQLLKHMIYHLLPTHRLPALNEIAPHQVMSQAETLDYLEELIERATEEQSSSFRCEIAPERQIQGKFMRIGGSVISLELLFQIYIHQVRNEFSILNANLPQGYVYTITPPSIFANAIGGAAMLNRLQALAFLALEQENLFSNLKVIGFNDYADKTMIPLLKKIFPNVEVVNQIALFEEDGGYKGPQGLALVLHNNSDAFGQNIETEGASSLDGVIGSYSNAASVLKRDRADLVDWIEQ